MALKDEKINFMIWEQILTGILTFAKVGEYKGIKFYIYPKEQGHSEPHLHVKYQGFEVSISLMSFKILSGNIPPQRQKQAIEWCKKESNKFVLEKYWDKYHEEIVA
jgi:hypothetical protein